MSSLCALEGAPPATTAAETSGSCVSDLLKPAADRDLCSSVLLELTPCRGSKTCMLKVAQCIILSNMSENQEGALSVNEGNQLVAVRGHLSFHRKVWSESAVDEQNKSLCHLFSYLSENHIYISIDDEQEPYLSFYSLLAT